MSEPVIDPRLASEADRAPRDQPLPVLISLAPLSADAGDPERLEARIHLAQAALRRHLVELGVVETPLQLTLSNALAVHLTASQIQAIARHRDVRRLTWNGESHVI